MTAPLDEKGWEATMRRIHDYTMDAEAKKWWLRFCEAQQDLNAAEAHIKALEGAQEMEVVGFMHPTADWCHRLYSEIDMHCPKDGPRPVALITLPSAQSALAAMSEELAIAERNRDAGRDNFHTMQQSAAELAKKLEQAELREGALLRDCEVYKGHAKDYLRRALTAEAQALRLTEENEALREERTSLIETKREQIERMQRRLDLHEAAIAFVRRWAVEKEGNGTSAEERLSAIAHHPALKEKALGAPHDR